MTDTPDYEPHLKANKMKTAEVPLADVSAKEEDMVDGKKQVQLEKPPMISFIQLFAVADRWDWAMMFFGTVGACANGAAWPIFAVIFGKFSNTFGNGTGSPTFMKDVQEIALFFLYLAIAAMVASYFQACLWMMAGNRQTNRLRQLYLRSVLRQDIAYFDTQVTTGKLLQGLNDDSTGVQQAISEKVGHFIQHMTTFFVGWIIAFWRGWDMTLVMVGCLPFLAIVGWALSLVTVKMTAQSQKAYTAASSIAQQSLSQIRTVAAYGGEEKVVHDYEGELEKPVQVGLKQAMYTGLSLGGINAVIYWTYAVAFYYGAWRVSTGAYDGGDVMNVIIAALIGGFSLGQATPVIETMVKGRVCGANMYAVMNRVPEINLEADGQVLDKVVGNIRLDNVRFAYPARPDIAVFRNFTLEIPAGKTVALVGSSGSGKSTVVSLIERFYDPAQGSVTLDGVDLRVLKLTWLRNQIALVSQEPTLFATTIYENIAMGLENATMEEVEAAARAANAYTFVMNLPEGFQTQVGERGLQLSGGQKQRIAIARAILKNPRIMLLDEATSALDTQSERVVQEALDRMVVGRTTVVVAHRLSTIKGADIIAVVSAGAIVEQGNHEELIKNPVGPYTTLVKLQMQQELEKGQSGPLLDEGTEGEDDDEDTPRHLEDAPEAEVAAVDAAQVAGIVGGTGHVALNVEALKGVAKKTGRTSLDKPLNPDEAHHDTPPATGVRRLFRCFKGSSEPKKEPVAVEPVVDVPLSRLLRYNRPELWYGVVGTIASGLNGVVQPAFAFVIASIIVLFYKTDLSEVRSKAGFWSWMFFTIGVGVLSMTFLQQYCFGIMGQQLAKRIRIALFKSILRQEIGWFDNEKNSSGILTSRLSADASHIRGAVGDSISLMLQNIVCLAFGYLISFGYMWKMALLVTGALPFMLAGAIIYYKTVTGYETGSDTMYAGANQAVSDAFSSVRVVQAFNLQKQVTDLYTRLLQEANGNLNKRSHLTGALMGYSQFSIFAIYSLIIWFGGREVDLGHSTFEDMLKAFLAILLAALGIAQAQIGFPDIGKAKAAVQAVFPIIDRKSLIDPSDLQGLTPETCNGEIQLRDVKFIYPSRPSVVVFKDFSLTIPAGKTVALVGESGSGKSTVVGLIERFYDPLEGSVTLDGINLRQYQLKWLRKQISLVSQEPLLFSCSVLDNIRYSRPEATLEEVIAAAKAANVHDVIEAMPDKYMTEVGERGVQLSGGQKQRVAIARAVVKNPRILLLDEATSALDAQAEKLVQEALDRIMVGRTSVAIAHRLSTIRNADLIALVYRGTVLEQGSHEQLMDLPDGGYARLVAVQMGSKTMTGRKTMDRTLGSSANLAGSDANLAAADVPNEDVVSKP